MKRLKQELIVLTSKLALRARERFVERAGELRCSILRLFRLALHVHACDFLFLAVNFVLYADDTNISGEEQNSRAILFHV